MKQIAKCRYVDEKKIVGANIYEKDGKTRVAISVDAVEKDKQVVFSDEFFDDNSDNCNLPADQWKTRFQKAELFIFSL